MVCFALDWIDGLDLDWLHFGGERKDLEEGNAKETSHTMAVDESASRDPSSIIYFSSREPFDSLFAAQPDDGFVFRTPVTALAS